MISAIVADHLETEFPSWANIGLAYLYCNYGQQQQQKADLLLNILKQIVQGQPVPTDAKELYQRHVIKQTCPSFDIEKVLQPAMQLYSRVFIIVDALDECDLSHEGCKRFLSELFNFQAKAEVKIFATSRFIPDIIREFEWSVSLEIRASEEDMQRYLEGHMSQLPLCVSAAMTYKKKSQPGLLTQLTGFMWTISASKQVDTANIYSGFF